MNPDPFVLVQTFLLAIIAVSTVMHAWNFKVFNFRDAQRFTRQMRAIAGLEVKDNKPEVDELLAIKEKILNDKYPDESKSRQAAVDKQMPKTEDVAV